MHRRSIGQTRPRRELQTPVKSLSMIGDACAFCNVSTPQFQLPSFFSYVHIINISCTSSAQSGRDSRYL